ncbi:MAG: pyridoxamine 5'-phosphate oxidase family protein [Anaerolineales bacterium]|nr:pyridoxamine 5'-phosphate oxidase family protein [Anaerolineales bacterium]
MTEPSVPTASRLEAARNVWLATVRPDGRPHLVPIWFVTAADRWYLCTAPNSVKARNLGANPHVALALEDGDQPYIVEGRARPVTPDPDLIAQFKTKYDWDITTDAHYTQVFEVVVSRRVMGDNK